MVTYKELKKDSIYVYEKFLYFLDKFDEEKKEDLFELINIKEREELKNIVKKIENNKFKLMILGEAKSGKSTFINTYLGLDELLPTDSLQCTSSIIEIKNGEKLKLTIIFANNAKEEYTDRKQIREMLLKSSSLIKVEKKYKDIPVARINNDIFLIKKGEKISLSELNKFIESVKEEKSLSMSDEDYRSLITEYISLYQSKWEKVIKKIIIEYPFKLESIKDIEIIDSPGLNAIGGLEDITKKYVKEADAIMFLQSSEAPVENKLLKKLIEDFSTNKNTSFLIITKSGKLSSNSLGKNFNEIHKYYGDKVKKNQIIYIDSVLKNYSSFIEKYKSYEELEKYIDNNESDIDPAVTSIIYKYRNIEKIINILKEKSNFKELEESLNLFGRKAHFYQLREFLEKFSKYLYKIKSKISEEISIYQIKDPEYFEKTIDDLLQNIRDIRKRLGNLSGEKSPEYFEKAKEEIEKNLNKVKNKFETVETYEEMKKIFLDEKENFICYQQGFIEYMISDLNEKVIKLEGNQIQFEYLEPNITSEELEEIDNIAKNNANEIKTIEEGWTFKKIKKVPYFSRDKYVKTLRESIFQRFESIGNNVINYMDIYIEEIIKEYEKTLKENLEKRRKELENTKKFKEENEKKRQKSELFISYRSTFHNYLIEIENYLSKIENILR